MDYIEIYRQNKLLRPDRERSLNTLNTYLPILDSLDKWLKGEYGLSLRNDNILRIKGADLEAYDRYLAERQYAASSRNLKLKVVRQFFGYLTDAGYLPYNPAKVIELVRVPQDEEEEARKERGLSAEEVAGIIRSAQGCNAARNQALVALIAGTGLRISEACSLNLSDFFRLTSAGYTYVRIKGGRRVRTFIADWAVPFLRRYVEGFRSAAAPEDPLFVTTQHTRLTRYTAEKAVRIIEERLGLKTGVHHLRHTVVTEVKRATGDITVAQAVAHHRSSRTTQGYDHDRVDARGALNATRLAQLMEGALTKN